MSTTSCSSDKTNDPNRTATSLPQGDTEMGYPGLQIVTNGTDRFWTGSAGDDDFDGSGFSEVFLTGRGDDYVFAGGADDVIWADLGNDTFDGGLGVDRLIFAMVNYAGLHGTIPEFGVTIDLDKRVQDLGYFGIKTLYSIEDVEGTDNADSIFGTDGANTLIGDHGNDLLYGRGGNDDLRGGEEADTLKGGSGDDLMSGGPGADRFYGGAGADRMSEERNFYIIDDGARDVFIYEALSDSGLSTSSRDQVFGDFDGPNQDRIDLSRIDANGSASGNGTFKFIGEDGFHANSTGEIQVRATGVDYEYLVKIDADTDTASEMTMLVYSLTPLTGADFIL
jgi:serralysin